MKQIFGKIFEISGERKTDILLSAINFFLRNYIIIFFFYK